MFSLLEKKEKIKGENGTYFLDKEIGKGEFTTVKLSIKFPVPIENKACKIVSSETLKNKIIY